MCMWLRWIFFGGGVGCNVECTNVVKKWQGSDCDNRGYEGAIKVTEVGFSNSALQLGVSPLVALRENKSLLSKICTC